nr:movement protein [Belladonna mottle virus]
MENVFPICSRSSQLNNSPGCSFSSHTDVSCSTPPGFSGDLSMASSKRSPPILEQPGNTGFILRDYSPPSPHPQNSGDFSPPSALEFPLRDSLHSALHETLQVSKAPKEESKLPRAQKLPTDFLRHSPVSNHLSHSSRHRVRLHARRSDVLPPKPDLRPLSQVAQCPEALLQLSDSTRIQLHGPLPPSRDLHLSDLRSNSSLRSGKSLLRFLQSTPERSQLAKNSFYSQHSHYAQRDHLGLLGPPPLYLDSTGASLTTPCSCVPVHHLIQFGSLQPVPACAHSTSFVQNPGSSRVTFRLLPESATQAPSCPCASLQLPLHLHQGSPNSSDLRPRRLRSHPKQQAPILLGHPKRLGQSPNLRFAERKRSAKNKVPLLGQPAAKNNPLSQAALNADLQSIGSPHLSPAPAPKALELPTSCPGHLKTLHRWAQPRSRTSCSNNPGSPTSSISSHSSEEIFYSPKAPHPGPGILGHSPPSKGSTSSSTEIQARKSTPSKLEVHARSGSPSRSSLRLPPHNSTNPRPILPRPLPSQSPSPTISSPMGAHLLSGGRDPPVPSTQPGEFRFSFFNSSSPGSTLI